MPDAPNPTVRRHEYYDSSLYLLDYGVAIFSEAVLERVYRGAEIVQRNNHLINLTTHGVLLGASCIHLMLGDIPETFPIPRNVDAEAVIRKNLKNARNHLPPPAGSGNLEQDIGEFLAQSVQVLDILGEGLTNGQHMTKSIQQLLAEMDEKNDLSESQPLDKLLETHSALRRISRSIHNTAKEVRLIWDEAKDHSLMDKLAVSPITPIPHEERLSSSIPTRGPSRRPSLASPGPREDANPRARSRIEVVKERGKGSYTCSLGRKCQKGGANPDGSLVIFERNSEYRTHMSKHAKPYRCNKPGCPNVKGFARQDQLKRHQSTVPHTVYRDEFGDLSFSA